MFLFNNLYLSWKLLKVAVDSVPSSIIKVQTSCEKYYDDWFKLNFMATATDS